MVWIALPISIVVLIFFIIALYRGYKFEREAERKESLVETDEIDLDNKN